MVLPLDFLLLIVITILTITLLLVNYVAYLSRGRRYGPFYEAAALVSGSVAISAFLGSAMVNLGQQYGTSALISRRTPTLWWPSRRPISTSCHSTSEPPSAG